MPSTQHALLLAAAMIGIAFLAIFDIVPEEFAQYAPLAMLAIFPSAWLGKGRCGGGRCAGRSA